MAKLSSELECCVKRSVELFMEGYGCCQSVIAAFSNLYNLDQDIALRIGAGFGGGIGRLRMVCGAVSGIVTLAVLEYGATNGDDSYKKAHCYKVVQDLINCFKEKNGSIICAELLAQSNCKIISDTHIPDKRNEQYYSTRPCAQKVEDASRIFAEYIMKNR